jgi:hypothetical protein
VSSEPCWICYRLDRIVWMQVLPLGCLEGKEVALGTNIMVACDACVNEMIAHDERVWKWADDGFYPSEYCDFMHEAYTEYREHNRQLIDDMENGGKLPLWPDELQDLTEQQIGREKSECVAYGPPPEIKWWKFKASDYPFQPMEQDEGEVAWSMSELDSETIDEEYLEEEE